MRAMGLSMKGLCKVWFFCLVLPTFGQADVSIDALEHYLNNLTVLRAKFDQIAPDGTRAPGVLFLKRPGWLRLEVPTKQMLIMADGKMLFYIDRQSGDVSYQPINESPAEILLSRRVDIRRQYDILRFNEEDETVELTLRSKGYPDAGQVMLIFKKEPLRLVSWTITDAAAAETTVRLLEVTRAKNITPETFDVRPYLR